MRLAHMISRGLMLDAEEVCARILLFLENLTLELWGALEGPWVVRAHTFWTMAWSLLWLISAE